MSGPVFDRDFMTAEVTIKYRVVLRRREKAHMGLAESIVDRTERDFDGYGIRPAKLEVKVLTDDEQIATYSYDGETSNV